jgi:hypothetical protein
LDGGSAAGGGQERQAMREQNDIGLDSELKMNEKQKNTY